jgi:hypothetical protein
MLIFSTTFQCAALYCQTSLAHSLPETVCFVFRSAHIHQRYEREVVREIAECIQHMQACCLWCRNWMWHISAL